MDFIYTNPASLKDDVLYFYREQHPYIYKTSNEIVEKALPPAMAPAFSFTGGTVKGSEQVILYALHYDQSKTIEEEFGYTELWTSLDHGATWKTIGNEIVNNDRSRVQPSYSMVSCSEFDAQHAYLVCNR